MDEMADRTVSRGFIFQLTREKVMVVKLQIATSPYSRFYSGKGAKKTTLRFTEQGIYMLLRKTEKYKGNTGTLSCAAPI